MDSELLLDGTMAAEAASPAPGATPHDAVATPPASDGHGEIEDEPIAAGPEEGPYAEGMWRTLREVNAAGTTVILTTHYLEEAESLCRNLAIIDHGRIIENGPMKALLAKLDVEGFLLDIDGELPARLPQIEGTALVAADAHTLDLEMPRAMDLNRVFERLGEAGIRVRSMRTRSNRLEELFVRLTGNREAAA